MTRLWRQLVRSAEDDGGHLLMIHDRGLWSFGAWVVITSWHLDCGVDIDTAARGFPCTAYLRVSLQAGPLHLQAMRYTTNDPKPGQDPS